LLTPGQGGITVLGEANAQLRYNPYGTLTGYRQRVDDGYVNPQDSRMIPNTFEGLTLRGQPVSKAEWFRYHLGYLWNIKPRNSNDFISIAEQAGVPGDNEGLALSSVTFEPLGPIKKVHLGNYLALDLFNTAFGIAEYERNFTGGRKLGLALQYTDQRAVGDELLGRFSTWSAGARLQHTWSLGDGDAAPKVTMEMAGHVTSDNATIRSPYGNWPGFLSRIQTDFFRAGEKAWGVSVKYEIPLQGTSDNSVEVLRSWSVYLAYTQGTDRLDPATKRSLPTTREVDLDLIYKWERKKSEKQKDTKPENPKDKKPEPLLELRFRNAYVDDGGAELGYQFRLTLNYEVDIL
jgi:hypothetical protein